MYYRHREDFYNPATQQWQKYNRVTEILSSDSSSSDEETREEIIPELHIQG